MGYYYLKFMGDVIINQIILGHFLIQFFSYYDKTISKYLLLMFEKKECAVDK